VNFPPRVILGLVVIGAVIAIGLWGPDHGASRQEHDAITAHDGIRGHRDPHGGAGGVGDLRLACVYSITGRTRLMEPGMPETRVGVVHFGFGPRGSTVSGMTIRSIPSTFVPGIFEWLAETE
jgi:hypothetical protein